MLGVVIVLAVAGTGMWIFSDDKRWGVVALILLIWGLVIAAFLIARYLRDLRGAEAKEHDLKTVYDLQLEREIAARREYELTVERELRAEIRGESNDELRALKVEVLALRANLEELLGRDLGPSYAELYATAQRQALEESRRSVFDDDDRVNAQSDFANMSAAPLSGLGPVGPVPSAHEESIDDYYGSGPAQSGQAPAYPVDQPAPSGFPGAAVQPATYAPAGGQSVPPPPSSAVAAAPGADDDTPTTVFSAVVDDRAAASETTRLLPSVGDVEPVDVEPVDVNADGGQHSSGSTVAELMARLNGAPQHPGGRRRRQD
jgi:hypothetical protein